MAAVFGGNGCCFTKTITSGNLATASATVTSMRRWPGEYSSDRERMLLANRWPLSFQWLEGYEEEMRKHISWHLMAVGLFGVFV